jgi:hypothetical protein
MGYYRDEPTFENLIDQITDSRWNYVMRRLEQKVATVVQRGNDARAKALRKVWRDMYVSPHHQLQRDCSVGESSRQRGDGGDDVIGAVLIDSGSYVRCASEARSPIGDCNTRHLKRLGEGASSVIYLR